MAVNKVILVGNLGSDPEIRYSNNGDAILNISVATSETRKDKQTGERKQLTEWHRVVFYGQLAEIVGKYLKKGDSMYVEGKIRTRKWTDQQGVDRYVTEIFADEMRMLGNKRNENGGDYAQQGAEYSAKNNTQAPNKPSKANNDFNNAPSNSGLGLGSDFVEDEIPF